MLEAWEPIRIFFAHNSVWIALLSVFLCFVLKDKKALRYSLLVAIFYIVGTFSSDFVRSIDEHQVIRYVYWALNDILFMGIVAYWAVKDKMYMWQSILAQLVVLPAPILQLFRLTDYHLMELSYSTYLYATIIPITNVVTLCLTFAPIIIFWQLKHNGEEVSYFRKSES